MEIDSILDSIKLMLGIDVADTSFDKDLIIYINGALMIMHQLGAGAKGFRITDNTKKWTDFTEGRTDLELVQTAVYLRVRLIFDPPQNAFLVDAIKEQSKEAEWRIEIDHIEEVIPEVPVE